MDFDFSDEQIALRDTVRKWMDRDYRFEHRRRIANAGGFSRDVWHAMADLGLLGLQISEEYGGLGLTSIEAMVVMEELGRGLLLEPYAHGALISPYLLAHARPQIRQRYLPAIVSGEALVTLAYQEPAARYRLHHVTTRALSSNGTWKLRGVKSNVPAAAFAQALLVPARTKGADDAADGVALFLVQLGSTNVNVRPYACVDGASAAEVAFADAQAELVVDAGPDPVGGFSVLEGAVDAGIAALCAEAVGVMESLLEMDVGHLQTRRQFGVPISSFQALRHRMADVKLQLELARSMSYLASLKLAEPADRRRRFLSQAKLKIGRAMRYVGQQSLQLHGAIGLTDEYIASHCFKRLTVMEMTFGDSDHHLGEVSRRMDMTAGVY